MESKIKITDNESIKRYHYRYFQVYITGILSEGLREFSDTETFELIPQSQLERDLYDLKITDKKSCIRLEKFNGQLEQDSKGILYWSLIMETSKVITKRLLAKTLSKALFKKKIK